MKNNVRLFSVIYAIVFTNLIEVILKKFDLDTYIILAGFRFHLIMIMPVFFIFRANQFDYIKKILLKPLYNKTFQPIGWIFLPLIIILILLYILKLIKIGDPEYFYEFGFSSIIDFPIYLLWNLPQLLIALIFFIVIQPLFKYQLAATTIIIIALWILEFIPMNKEKINIYGLMSLFFSAAVISLIIKYFQNIYWISIIIFSILWSNLLAFGSKSQTLIHILFAATYNSWDGFFEVSKGLINFLLPAQILITIILISFSILKRKHKHIF